MAGILLRISLLRNISKYCPEYKHSCLSPCRPHPSGPSATWWGSWWSTCWFHVLIQFKKSEHGISVFEIRHAFSSLRRSQSRALDSTSLTLCLLTPDSAAGPCLCVLYCGFCGGHGRWLPARSAPGSPFLLVYLPRVAFLLRQGGFRLCLDLPHLVPRNELISYARAYICFLYWRT